MSLKETAEALVECLEKIYPDALCSLTYKEPYELMIAGRLSAQCTDARVNIVTKELFAAYPTLKSFADAGIDDVAEIIRPCGLYKTKAKSIVEMTHALYYDLKTKDVLKQALLDFDGTLIVVTHDRDFLDGLVSKVYEFGHGRVREHLCGIYEFLESKKMENLQELEKKQ
mgnify:CR=1 FL=1